MSQDEMVVVLIHWRIKPECVEEFINHWKTNNTIGDKSGLVGEFLSDSLKIADFPFITWHLDPESLGDCKSFVTIGVWKDAKSFKDQVAQYFNDDRPLLGFEKYRRRRVIFRPIAQRIGDAKLPKKDSSGVK